MTEPTRLADAAPDGLGGLLLLARRDVPGTPELERLAARLSELGLTGPEPNAPLPETAPLPGAPASAGHGASLAARILTGTALLGLLGGGAGYLAWSSSHPEDPGSEPTRIEAGAATDQGDHQPGRATASPPPPATAPSLADAVPGPRSLEAGDPAEPSTPSSIVSETVTGAPPARPPVAESRPQTPADGPSEVALLQQAQAALKSNPKLALSLTQTHRERYPKGALAQEREVIAIEALARMKRAEEAERRAAGFAKTYPGSAHQQKVEETVDASAAKGR